MSEKMSLDNNRTVDLFRKFMPRRKELSNRIGADIFDLKVYPTHYFMNYNPSLEFVKWALVEVSEVNNIPRGMEAFELSEGEYAVFKHTSLSSDNSIFQYIFTEWLPNSDYQLDERPHFDILKEKTNLKNPNSEEEIWIPVRSISE